MNITLRISLISFSIIWLIFILRCIKYGKLSIKYSLPWLFASILFLLVTIFPNFLLSISDAFGFLSSDFVVGIILTLLLIITLILTMIVTNQKTQIKNLIQEVSILKSKKKEK